MPLKRQVCLLGLLFISFFSVSEINIKGSAETVYDGWGKPSAEETQTLKKKAENAALSRWASQQGASFLKNYDLVRSQIEDRLADYVITSTVITEVLDKETKRFNMVVKVTLDDTRLLNFVNDSSTVANTNAAEKSLLTFVFVSRRQDSIQQFDKKVFKREDRSSYADGAETEINNGSDVSFNSKSTSSDEVTLGGSSTRKADNITYKVASASEINITMTEVFSNAGFEVVEAEYIEEETAGLLKVDNFKADFSSGDDISGTTQRNAAKGAKMIDLPYLAVGTLDIGLAEDDSSTGLKRVAVTVTGKLIGLNGRFPKTIAAVGPVQIAGVGPTSTEAEKNALKVASERAATELVNQLNSKSIK
ncbi:hypothetical protein [Shewanella baltica]|uniref:hypothetical protein n=1 Tax=Shewanella baltica TaxID=62322 RepID=UPI00217DFB92|nr:hypothetical protein [Shewanella baltica]MCS6173240.1 hypothetical protein [Shewanella baltica]